MKKNNIWLYVIGMIAGGVLLFLGRKVFVAEELKMLAGICFGFGSAFFVLGIGNLVGAFTAAKFEDQEVIRQKRIEENDERNIRILDRSRAKANQVLVYILSIIILVLGFMNVELYVIILFASLLLVQFVLVIIFSNYYAKRM